MGHISVSYTGTNRIRFNGFDLSPSNDRTEPRKTELRPVLFKAPRQEGI
jgi:hypothetical protein